ncbi:C2H2-like zinc finger protein [Melia azedarach]|uniref:C2H2-like zinc finger protein n=1 Tax=Melia azedarach TaxID=155640 RepID=A0ACC1XPH0_MELAZ|nr:C2H2-like zinc finger protein [Melia azedarach]
MASGWVKSLQCKSRAFDDVYHPNPKNLLPSTSCRRSSQSIKDVIEATTKKHPKHPRKVKPPTKSEPGGGVYNSSSVRARHSHSHSHPASDRPARNPEHAIYPALTELPDGHPSRNVVEIIFHTSWGPKPFAGRIEMIFKVQHGSRTVARFEEYRDLVKSRAGSGLEPGRTSEENARCVADGNEVMRFYCLGPTSDSGAYGAWGFPGGKGAAICTYSGSSGAHESAGGGRGRRAMLVCRVIAGRVSKKIGYDSVSGESDELLVFDSRAVLPCFLIIYKL